MVCSYTSEGFFSKTGAGGGGGGDVIVRGGGGGGVLSVLEGGLYNFAYYFGVEWSGVGG
jgi:hypothetical protein